jgi:membrane fusion protein (multidrug efflux system)/multidrug efflux system membrane fusion protein
MKFRFHQLLLPVALSSLLVSCGKPESGRTASPDSMAPRSVRVARAELRPLERTVPVVGTLAAHEEAVVAAQVAGQIEKALVDLGDRVTAGQEMVLIDTTAYEARVRESAANLARATAAAANAERQLKRVQELQRDNIASNSDLDAAVSEAGKTQADVKALEAADAIARLNLERSRVRAPFDGAVAQRVAGVGDYLSVGTPIARLVKTDPLRLRIDVPERESGAIRTGLKVRVMVEGDTNIYTGKIARVAPALREADRMLAVEADVPAQGSLRVGRFVRAEIVVNDSEAALVVPEPALIVFAGLEKVVSAKDGKVTEKAVTTGRRGADWVEIVSGLNAGELVVLEPAGLRTGQTVIIESNSTTTSNGDTNSGGAR